LIVPDLNASSGPIVIGISGRISAGKTTTARLIEQRGFAYTRISAVVDEVIRSRGLEPSRQTRQTVGLEIHQTAGQRWLCEQALERVKGQSLIVVDGLRFLEDHAFFVERFGSRFFHVHVAADPKIRAKRYHQEDPEGPAFETADSQPVEAETDALRKRAMAVLINEGTITDLQTLVGKSLEQYLPEGIGSCQYPSS
jgi:dephospho-CoA kinase